MTVCVNSIGGPRQLRKQARRIEEARADLTIRHGRSPAEEEIALQIGMTLKEFQTLSRDLSGLDLLSIQAESNDESYPNDLDSNFACPSSQNPYELCARSEMKGLLRDALLALPKREAQMLVLYYFEDFSMKQIGLLFGVVESRISQMHAAVMLRLRARLARAHQHDRAGTPRHLPSALWLTQPSSQ